MEKENSVMQGRLRTVCSVLGCSERTFAHSIGKSPAYIANLKKDITTNVLLNIYINYPQVNIMWIITGEGDILLKREDETSLSNDASLLLRMFNEDRLKIATLEEENKNLQNEVHRLVIENVKLKQKLGVDDLVGNKAG